jgi:hypothetical protein
LSGDRRLIRVQFTDERDSSRAILADGTFNSKWVICAETQADAIAARGGQSALTINDRGSATDEYIEALTVTNVRTQLSDVVRQLGWQVCNAFMNGALTKKEYGDHLQKLREGALLALKPKGDESPNASEAAKPGEGNAAKPTPNVVTLPEAPKTPCKAKKGKTCPAS